MESHKTPEGYPILTPGTHVRNPDGKMKVSRPTIFVGSSIESKAVAERVRQGFHADEFEVDIWYDGVFGETRTAGAEMSNIEWLKNFTDIYDFAIFLFVPDDRIVSATRQDNATGEFYMADATRHNVVFEFGMFLGRVGARRSFILFDEAVNNFVRLFFTDLKENLDDTSTRLEIKDDFRIELYPYKGNYIPQIATGTEPSVSGVTVPPPYDEASLSGAIEEIKKQIRRNFKKVDIGFLPATTLAFGYFNNFAEIFVRNLNIMLSDRPYPARWLEQGMNEGDITGWITEIKQATAVELRIVIPTSLEGSRQEKFIPFFEKSLFTHRNFPGHNRAITVLMRTRPVAENRSGMLIIYDVPTTLNSSIEAIEMLTPYQEVRELLKEKELRNFRIAFEYKMALAGMIAETSNLEKIISIIGYDEFMAQTH